MLFIDKCREHMPQEFHQSERHLGESSVPWLPPFRTRVSLPRPPPSVRLGRVPNSICIKLFIVLPSTRNTALEFLLYRRVFSERIGYYDYYSFIIQDMNMIHALKNVHGRLRAATLQVRDLQRC